MAEPSTAGTAVDGDFSTAVQSGPWTQLIDNETQSVGWTREMWVYAPNWARSSFTDACPNDATAFLTDETTPTEVLSEVVKWTQNFWQKPSARSEYDSFTYAYQFIVSVDGKDQICELPITVTSRMAFAYYLILPSGGDYTTPDDIPKITAYKAVQITPDTIYIAGTAPSGSEWIGQDSVLRRWKGNIYERKTMYVPSLTVSLS